MECVSISFRAAKAAEREPFAFDQDAAEHFLKKLKKEKGIEECVLLSTCSRTEIYVQGEQSLFSRLEELLADAAKTDVDKVRLLARCYQGKKAVWHLFEVACGMDSMVIGEDEVLGQVREAYMRSQKEGYTGYELDAVFQGALACAKKIKTRTELSKTSVSIATLAANEVFRVPVQPKCVLLIGGSGQVGSALFKNIVSHGGIRLIVTTRSHKGDFTSAAKAVESVDYKDRYEHMEEADIIISATSSPHYTVTAGKAGEAMRTRKNRLFIDLAMPADIDGKIAMMENCTLLTIDDFRKLAEENNGKKQQALLDARDILEEEADTLYKSMAFHGFSGKMEEWKEKYGEYPLEKLLYKLRDELDSNSFEAVLRALDK